MPGLEDGEFFWTFEAFYKCVCFYKLPSVSSLATASAEGPVEVEEAGAACQGLSVIEAGSCSSVDARYQS